MPSYGAREACASRLVKQKRFLLFDSMCTSETSWLRVDTLYLEPA